MAKLEPLIDQNPNTFHILIVTLEMTHYYFIMQVEEEVSPKSNMTVGINSLFLHHQFAHSSAMPAKPTAPNTHETAFACDAAPVGAGEALVLGVLSVEVPLGLPAIFWLLTLMPVPFLQLLL